MPSSRFLLAVTSTLALAGVAAAGEVVWWTPSFNAARARELAATFEAEHPDIAIRLEITDPGGLPQRVQAALESGAAPDIVDIELGRVNGYARDDLVRPLDAAIEDRDDYLPAALDCVSWNGRLWAVPYRVETQAVIFNKGHFTTAGLDPEDPPETWDDLVEAAKALTGERRFGFAITGGGKNGHTLLRSRPFVWMNGGSIVSDDLKAATVNQPAAVEAVVFYTDFYRRGLSPASTLENDAAANRRLFVAGTVSMYQSGPLDIAAIRRENPGIDIGVMPIPHTEARETAAVLGGWSFVIPSSAANPDEAKTVVRWLAKAENQAALTETFPARASAMSLPRFDDPTLAGFKAMLPHARPLPKTAAWPQIAQAYVEGIRRILRGEEDPRAAMDTADDEIQALLDE